LTTANENPTERALSSARLPDSLEDWHVLALGPGEPGRDHLSGIGAERYLALDAPSDDAAVEGGSFDLVVCGCDVEINAHPLTLYAWVRRLLKPGGTLVAGSAVMPDPTRSQYARFVPGESGQPSRWVPGRLTFRWMVEVSGFDVSGWLDAVEGPHDRETVAFLQAAAVDRTPALDLERQPLNG